MSSEHVREYKVRGWRAAVVWWGLLVATFVPWFVGFITIVRWVLS